MPQLKRTCGLFFSSLWYRIYRLRVGKLCYKGGYLTGTQLGWCHWWQHTPDRRTILHLDFLQRTDQSHSFCPRHSGILFDIWRENKLIKSHSHCPVGWGGVGTGGREGYGRGEREGREAGDLKWREAGEKCEKLFFLIQQCVTKLLKSKNPKYIWLAFNVFSVTSETSEQTSKPKFALGLKNRLTSGEIVNPLTVVTS